MSFKIIKTLKSGEELRQLLPLSHKNKLQVEQDQRDIFNILSGADQRLLMIVGPCSAWPQSAVLKYAKKLAELNQEIKHAIKLVMRVYIQKPRTTKGWTGPINQPNPFAASDIDAGAFYCRKMMLDVINLGLPIADEALFTHNRDKFHELLSWVAIGARSSEDPEHRIFASALDCPVGLKNPTHGTLDIAVNSIVAAQYPHVATFHGQEIETSGNPYAHLVLRGSNRQPNYDNESLWKVIKAMSQHNIKNPSVMIDVSHDNCLINGKKRYEKQATIIFKILDNIKKDEKLRSLVKGFMVESFIEKGNQKISSEKPGVVNMQGLSITDPCFGWLDTKKMLLKIAGYLS